MTYNRHVIYRRHLLEHFLVQTAADEQHRVNPTYLSMFLARCVGLSPQEVSKQFNISVGSRDVAQCKGKWLEPFQDLVDSVFQDPRLKKLIDPPPARNQPPVSKNPPKVRHNDLAHYTQKLGFFVWCEGNLPSRLYSLLEIVDKYHYREKITVFTALNSATIIEKIREANPESPAGSHFSHLNFNQIDSEIRELVEDFDQAKDESDWIKVLKAFAEIASTPGVTLRRPELLQDIAKCYYRLGAFTDCISVLDYALSLAHLAVNPAWYKYGVYVWLASGIRSILCNPSNVQHFTENLRDLQYLAEQVKGFNVMAYRCHQPTPAKIKRIEALWNVFYLTPALHMAYDKTKACGSIDKIETAYNDLRELVMAVEQEETNFSRYTSGILEDVAHMRKSGIPIPDSVNLLIDRLVEP
jgi:hypothetical protein